MTVWWSGGIAVSTGPAGSGEAKTSPPPLTSTGPADEEQPRGEHDRPAGRVVRSLGAPRERSVGMANSHITAAWERAPLAKGNDLLVLLSLADQANDDGWCWPGQGSLVRRTKTSRATVQRAIGALAQAGYIEVHER